MKILKKKKNHLVIHCKWVNRIVCELFLNVVLFLKKRKKGGDHDCLVQHVVPGGVPVLEGGEMQRTASRSQRAMSGREREGGGGRRSHAPLRGV